MIEKIAIEVFDIPASRPMGLYIGNRDLSTPGSGFRNEQATIQRVTQPSLSFGIAS
jgi:hypothetical protein